MRLGCLLVTLLLITSCNKGKEMANFQIIIDRPNWESQLLISEMHIEHYSFANQEIYLNETGVEQIMNVIIDDECTFHVIFKEDTIAHGICVDAVLSSFPTDKPIIYFGVHQRIRLGDSNSFTIYCHQCTEGFDGLKSQEIETFLVKKGLSK